MGDTIRDFSQKREEELKEMITRINDDQWNFITDMLGDLVLTFFTSMQLLDIEDLPGKIDTYHQAVLDQHDTTHERLSELFANARAVDKRYAMTFGEITTVLEERIQCLRELAGMINPSVSVLSSSAVRASRDDMIKLLERGDKRIDTIYDAALDYRSKKVAKDSLKELIWTPVKVVGDVVDLTVSLAEAVATGNWGAPLNSMWGMINDMFSVGGDMVALGLVGIGAIAGLAGSNSMRRDFLEKSEESRDIEGLADVLRIDGHTKAAAVVDTIDEASEVYSMYDDLTSAKPDGREKSKLEEKLGYQKGAVKFEKTARVFLDAAIDGYEEDGFGGAIRNVWNEGIGYSLGKVEGKQGEKWKNPTKQVKKVKEKAEETGKSWEDAGWLDWYDTEWAELLI